MEKQVIATENKKIILARHGETAANRDGFIMGRSDFPLTPEGILVAEKVGFLLKSEIIEAVFCSPLGRALASARIYLDGSGLPIVTKDSLAELACGDWERKRRNEVTNGKYSIRETWFDRPPGGESYCDAESRAESVIQELSSNITPENILVVGHAGINRVLLKLFLNLESDAALRLQCPHDTVYVITGSQIEARSVGGHKTKGLVFAR